MHDGASASEVRRWQRLVLPPLQYAVAQRTEGRPISETFRRRVTMRMARGALALRAGAQVRVHVRAREAGEIGCARASTAQPRRFPRFSVCQFAARPTRDRVANPCATDPIGGSPMVGRFSAPAAPDSPRGMPETARASSSWARGEIEPPTRGFSVRGESPVRPPNPKTGGRFSRGLIEPLCPTEPIPNRTPEKGPK